MTHNHPEQPAHPAPPSATRHRQAPLGESDTIAAPDAPPRTNRHRSAAPRASPCANQQHCRQLWLRLAPTCNIRRQHLKPPDIQWRCIWRGCIWRSCIGWRCIWRGCIGWRCIWRGCIGRRYMGWGYIGWRCIGEAVSGGAVSGGDVSSGVVGTAMYRVAIYQVEM